MVSTITDPASFGDKFN